MPTLSPNRAILSPHTRHDTAGQRNVRAPKERVPERDLPEYTRCSGAERTAGPRAAAFLAVLAGGRGFGRGRAAAARAAELCHPCRAFEDGRDQGGHAQIQIERFPVQSAAKTQDFDVAQRARRGSQIGRAQVRIALATNSPVRDSTRLS